MSKIYDRFDSATSNLSAVGIVRDGHAVGRIVIKFGAAATAYVQIWGAAMVSGRAGGGGYDKATAAVADAVRKLSVDQVDERRGIERAAMERLCEAFADNGAGGTRWMNRLEDRGFVLVNVIG